MEDELDLGRYLRVLRRWYRLILLCGILAGLTAFLVLSLLPRSYVAEADLAVVRALAQVNLDSKIQTVADTDPNSNQLDQVAFRKSLVTLGSSRQQAQEVLAQVGSQFAPVPPTADALLDAVKVTSEGTLIRIQASARTPEQAALLANTWAQIYLKRVNEIYSDSTFTAGTLTGTLEESRRDYEQKQAALVAYLADNPSEQLKRQLQLQRQVLDEYFKSVASTQSSVFNKQSEASVDKLARLYALRNGLDNLLIYTRSLRERLGSSNETISPAEELATVLLESSAFSVGAQLTGTIPIQIQIGQPASDATPEQQTANLDKLIATLEASRRAVDTQITDLSQTLVVTSRSSYLDRLGNAAASAEVTRLQAELDRLESQIETEDGKRQELVRARDLAKTKYTALANRQAENDISNQSAGGLLRLATTATVPDEPQPAGRLGGGLLGLAGGLLVGTALAFVLNARYGELGNADEMATALGLANLGTVPEWSADRDAGGNALVDSGAPAPVVDSFQTMRHYVMMTGRRVVMLTSAAEGAGASDIAANLAVTTALAGKRVLLVDANLRAPALHREFDVERGRGLADWLMQAHPDADLASYARTTRVPGLALVTAGAPLRDPPAALERLSAALPPGDGADGYDLVIVCAPPVLGVVDALVIARAAEGAILVIDSQSTPPALATRARDRLREAGAPILGVVLNRVRQPDTRAADAARPASPQPDARSGAGRGAGWWSALRARLMSFVAPH